LAKATEGVAGVTCDMPSQTGQNKVMFISDLFFYMSRIQTCPKVFQNCPKLKMFQMYPKQAWGRRATVFFSISKYTGHGGKMFLEDLRVLEAFSQTRHRSHDLRTKSLAARLSVQPLPLLVCLGYGYGRAFKERRVALYIDPFNKYKWYKATDKISNYS
jgi:hypothetical protein